MSARLRIAHCSDIHLGSDAKRGPADDGACARFAAALSAMAGHGPDMLLLAGDLFDRNDPPNATVAWAMAALEAFARPVVMIPGNHDCLAPGGVYRRFDFGGVANVRFLGDADGSSVVLPGLDVTAWGRGMVDHAPDFRPLQNAPPARPATRWHVGLGHGLFVPRGESTSRASPVRMEEIEAARFDYLALGHHHAAMDVSGRQAAAAYSGSPTDDIGMGPTYVVVELREGEAPHVAIRRVD